MCLNLQQLKSIKIDIILAIQILPDILIFSTFFNFQQIK